MPRSPRRMQRKQEKQRAVKARVIPFIAERGAVAACLINKYWREDGMAAIYLLRRNPLGGHALASFLIDLNCFGLKDAFTDLDASALEFERQMEQIDPVSPQVSCDLALARRLVAGGLRLAEEQGFRLPPRYQRCVALLGELGDWHSADLSDFLPTGRLFFCGPRTHLVDRLQSCTLEQFLARADVDVVLTDDLDSPQAELEAMEEEERYIARLAQRLAQEIRPKLFADGQVPHASLGEALELFVSALIQTSQQLDESDADEATDSAVAPTEPGKHVIEQALLRQLAFEQPETRDNLMQALDQVHFGLYALEPDGGIERIFREVLDEHERAQADEHKPARSKKGHKRSRSRR